MKKSKPTTPPWTVGYFGHILTTQSRIVGTAPRRAEAILMAAAPELLHALRVLVLHHRCACEHPHCNACARDRLADAAIAKAEGPPRRAH